MRSALRLALVAILRNLARSLLTVLGMSIGVAAVLAVITLAEGASGQVAGAIDSFAANGLFVTPQVVQNSGARGQASGRLTDGDARAIDREAISVQSTTSWLSTSAQVVFQERNVATIVAGVTLPYLEIRKYEVARGEAWQSTDETLKSKVVLLGASVADQLFGADDPVGQTVRIAGVPHKVVGVLLAKGSTPLGEDQDDRVLMPIGSFRARVRRTAPDRADQLMAQATTSETMPRAKEQITAIMRQRHQIREGDEDDFAVNTQAEFRAMQQGITDSLSMLLIGVAAVSLVVAGIGVMNIMLVSVAERTREIGVRMSIGASARDIRLQFLFEAMLLSLAGGVIGVVLGGLGTQLAGRALGWSITLSPSTVLLAMGSSTLLGVVFGFLPAQRAASHDPIAALRTE